MLKVGDKVVCVDDRYSFNRLREGHEYIIEPAYDGTPVVIVNGAYHSIERFMGIERFIEVRHA